MTALHRKLVRDLWQMKGQALAICLVIACGVATFVMSLCTLESLQRTQTLYYEAFHFAQVFAHLKRAPEAVAARIAEIPGVAQVQTRIVEHVTLDMPALQEPAVGRLISLPGRGGMNLNARYIRKGRHLDPSRTGEVLVSEGFASAHGIQPGDSIQAVLNGRLQTLRMVGVALSPEHIYAIREGDLLPDERRFGVFWMGYQEMAAAFDMQGAFNDVCLTLSPGASEPEVVRRLDRILEPYGGLGAYGRDDQPSHKFVSNELKELRGMAIIVPTIFLLVAAFLLHVVVSRLVNTQREQIAALKAFGYSRLEIATHYLQLVLFIVLMGVTLGTIVGARLGWSVTHLYTRFFHFPVFTFYLAPDVMLEALAVSVGVGLVGTLAAVARAASLPPAEAMRPEPPARYRATLLERFGLQRLLSPAGRMILRNLERQPVRSGMSILGLALAVAVLILGNFMVDAVDYAIESQFHVAQRQDLTLAFVEPSSPRVLAEIVHLPGVRTCEPMRALPTRIRHGPRSRRVGITGLRPDSQLNRVMDLDRNLISLPDEGLVLSAKLAEVLEVSRGGTVVVEVLEGRRPSRELVVTGLVNDFAGVTAYMNIGAANRLMEEGDVVTGAFVAADAGRMEELFRCLKEIPRVSSVSVRGTALATFRQTVAENLLRMRLFNVIFASVIAAGVVYNSARIALAERSRELATLRVMGFYRTEISFVLLGELAVLTLAALPLGLILGHGLAALVIHLAYDTELFRIPLIIAPSTYALAVSVTLTAALLSGLIVRRMLDHLDLVAVLKSKE